MIVRAPCPARMRRLPIDRGMLIHRSSPWPALAGRRRGTSRSNPLNGAAYVTFHPAAIKALIWRCLILESSGLWPTVTTRAEWARAGRLRALARPTARAATTEVGPITEVRRCAPEAPHRGCQRIAAILLSSPRCHTPDDSEAGRRYL